MADLEFDRVERRPTTTDLSWFLDLDKNDQLNLNPSYQRRSVWTPSDRRYFLDTIFRNYPSPAIFLHKSIDDEGNVKYHVVDGKQRISTIIMFAANKIALPKDFGNERLDGKKWKDLEPSLRRVFWNYPIPIEQIDALQAPVINDVFARLNKNSRKLTRQELRHARFDGWFITFVEAEALDSVWKTFKVRTTAKEKRMVDVQNLSELSQVVVEGSVSGFDQFRLDELYAELEEADGDESDFDTEAFLEQFHEVKLALMAMEDTNEAISTAAQPFIHLYSLWALLVTEKLDEDAARAFAPKYVEFMAEVARFELGGEDSESESEAVDDEGNAPSSRVDEDELEVPVVDANGNPVSEADREVARYKIASVGATTEPPQRRARLQALREVLRRA
jgi:hypothetical protein